MNVATGLIYDSTLINLLEPETIQESYRQVVNTNKSPFTKIMIVPKKPTTKLNIEKQLRSTRKTEYKNEG